MPLIDHPQGKFAAGLGWPIAIALAIKIISLAVLYVAFFVPSGAPSPERAATAVFGLSNANMGMDERR